MIQFSRWLVEHDGYNEGSFVKYYVEAPDKERALQRLYAKDRDLDWGSGRFTTRVTWLEDL